jgi:hypothetical protein
MHGSRRFEVIHRTDGVVVAAVSQSMHAVVTLSWQSGQKPAQLTTARILLNSSVVGGSSQPAIWPRSVARPISCSRVDVSSWCHGWRHWVVLWHTTGVHVVYHVLLAEREL